MRQSRRLVLGVSFVILVSLAVALPAAAKPTPTGSALPFTFAGSGFTFDFPANAPFYLQHDVIGVATTKKGLAQLKNASTGFQVVVDGVVQSCTPEITITESGGVYTVNHGDLCNFPAGMTGTHTFVFNFYDAGAVFFTETETYVFS